MIFKRGDIYYYEFELRGRRYRESTNQKNPRTARQMEAARRTGILKGEVGIRTRKQARRFADFADNWIKTYATAHCKYSTRRSYEGVLKKHLKPAFSGKLLDEITRQDVGDTNQPEVGLEISEGQDDNSGNGEEHPTAPLREMLNHAVDAGIIIANPANRAGRYMKEESSQNEPPSN